MSKQANNILVKQFKVNTQHIHTAATPSLTPTAMSTAHPRVHCSICAELAHRTS